MKIIQQITVLLLLLMVTSSRAQSPREVTDLKLNSAPAFVILGVEPENIDRPGSPQKFVAGIQTGLVNGKVKPNFAMEFNPFNWAVKTDTLRTLNANAYLFSNSNGEVFKRNFSFSLATSESDTNVYGSLRPGTGLGLGLQFLVYGGKGNKWLLNNYQIFDSCLALDAFITHVYAHLKQGALGDAYSNLVKQKETNYNNVCADLLARWQDTLGLYILKIPNAGDSAKINDDSKNWLISLADLQDAQTRAIAEINNNKAYLSEDCKRLEQIIVERASYIRNSGRQLDDANLVDVKRLYASRAAVKLAKEAIVQKINGMRLINSRYGSNFQISLAQSTIFESGKIAYGKFGKASIGAVYSYRFELTADHAQKVVSLLDVMGVFRFNFNSKLVDSVNTMDLGLKVQYTYNRFSLSGELIGRFLTRKPDYAKSNFTYRSSINLGYKVNDFLTFKSSFGVNFDGNSKVYSNPKDLFAVAGLNLGIMNMVNNLSKTGKS